MQAAGRAPRRHIAVAAVVSSHLAFPRLTFPHHGVCVPHVCTAATAAHFSPPARLHQAPAARLSSSAPKTPEASHASLFCLPACLPVPFRRRYHSTGGAIQCEHDAARIIKMQSVRIMVLYMQILLALQSTQPVTPDFTTSVNVHEYRMKDKMDEAADVTGGTSKALSSSQRSLQREYKTAARAGGRCVMCRVSNGACRGSCVICNVHG